MVIAESVPSEPEGITQVIEGVPEGVRFVKADCPVHGLWSFERVNGNVFSCAYIDHEEGVAGLRDRARDFITAFKKTVSVSSQMN